MGEAKQSHRIVVQQISELVAKIQGEQNKLAQLEEEAKRNDEKIEILEMAITNLKCKRGEKTDAFKCKCVHCKCLLAEMELRDQQKKKLGIQLVQQEQDDFATDDNKIKEMDAIIIEAQAKMEDIGRQVKASFLFYFYLQFSFWWA